MSKLQRQRPAHDNIYIITQIFNFFKPLYLFFLKNYSSPESKKEWREKEEKYFELK